MLQCCSVCTCTKILHRGPLCASGPWLCTTKRKECLTIAKQGLSVQDYEAKKEEVAAQFIDRLDAVFPGLKQGVVFKEVRPRARCARG